MSVPANQSTAHPFNVYSMIDANTKDKWVGGSYDNISAVTVASAIYQARQGYSPDTEALVAVFNDTDTMIAIIGHTEQ